ncbi:interferon-inducible GTPase 5-like [Neolamprologus brichardi]|uniref:interferon-inducible GTPase 5-like n=1 Tax=Neolamprologus brichardi TaxID=32507 RepID=UPI001643C02D|nr:interferon-inducible GTPase 5-like [Neolamprologus brichardi]
MEDPNDSFPEEVAAVKEDLKNNDSAAAAAKIQEYLDKQNDVLLNIAITGASGAGKSTFINALRELSDDDERAAPTGVTETTMVVEEYPHPNYPNVRFLDLPGVGTPNFPSDTYLERVGFEKFDFFIIISASRFTENDMNLAKEIQKIKKKFYFVRSRIDNDINAEKRKKDFSEEKTLEKIRQDCIGGLQEQGIKSPQVFLVSSFKLRRYDFSLLHDTLERELPAHKRDALLFALPNINLEIISKKKEAFQSKIKYWATLSAAAAGVPVPGYSICMDLSMMVNVAMRYVVGFGLNKPSLERLSASSGVPYTELLNVLKSPLATAKITQDLLLKLLSQTASTVALMALEEGSRWIPLIGIPLAVGLSFTTTCSALNYFLNELADDAQRVFKKALGLNTSV